MHSFSRFNILEELHVFVNILNNYFLNGITEALNLKQISIGFKDLPVTLNRPITDNFKKLQKLEFFSIEGFDKISCIDDILISLSKCINLQ